MYLPVLHAIFSQNRRFYFRGSLGRLGETYRDIHGRAILKMKKARFFLITLLLWILLGGLVSAESVRLSDIDGHWAERSINLLAAQGIVHGLPDGTFDPNGYISRAEFAKLLVTTLRMDGDYINLRNTTSRFLDVPRSYWGNPYIIIANDLGLIDGYPDSTFRPNEPIRRSEVAKMSVLSYSLISGETPIKVSHTLNRQKAGVYFSDSMDIPAWSLEYVVSAYEVGLVQGYPEGDFRPDGYTTRAEAAVIMERLLDKQKLTYDLWGDVLKVESNRLTMLVSGTEITLRILPSTHVYRNGESGNLESVQLTDQVGVVLSAHGTVLFVDAWHGDRYGKIGQLSTSRRTITFENGETFYISRNAPVYLNGHQASISSLSQGDYVYLMVDKLTGWGRSILAYRPGLSGTVQSVGEFQGEPAIKLVTIFGEEHWLQGSSDVLVLEGSELRNWSVLTERDQVQVVLDKDGLAKLVVITKKANRR